MAPKEVYCKKCDGRHTRPVGRRCTVNVEDNSSMVGSNISISQSSDPSPTQQSALDTVLAKLQQMEARQEQLAVQVMRLENDRYPQPERSSTPTREHVDRYNEEGVVPSLEFLKSSSAIQTEVARRLRALDADTANPSGKFISHSNGKSGRFRTFNTNIHKYIQWPQENVFIGASRKPISYDDLNPQQFILGHLITAMAADNITEKDNMINYIIKLLRESIDGSFESSLGAHAIVLQELERGTLTWGDTQKLDELRLLYSRKVSANEHTKRTLHSPAVKKVVCSHYNKGKCIKKSDHTVNDVMYRHVCLYCYKATSKFFAHSEQECNRKSRKENISV